MIGVQFLGSPGEQCRRCVSLALLILGRVLTPDMHCEPALHTVEEPGLTQMETLAAGNGPVRCKMPGAQDNSLQAPVHLVLSGPSDSVHVAQD